MEGQELYHQQYYHNTSPFMIGAENWHCSSSSTTSDNNNNNKASGDHFVVEEFLDFSNEDHEVGAGDDGSAGGFDTSAAVDSCNSSSFSGCDPINNYHPDVSRRNLTDGQFSGELFLPYDDMAELEWLSNIVEEESSFSSEDLQRLQLISGIKARSTDEISADRSTNNHDHHHHNQAAVSSVPAKTRSKRSRAPPCNWTSRLLLLSSDAAAAAAAAAAASEDSSSSDAIIVAAPPPPATKPAKPKKKKEQGGAAMAVGGREGEGGRRCLHCATDKTPQWRTGPMGPKTLCNACGVRYKSGRLVPEYRPAASPTFVLTKHSNSHRKVIELRRQKDVMRAHHQNNNNHHHQQQQQQHFVHGGMVFDHHAPPPSSSSSDHYLMIHHVPSRDPISDKSWM